MATKAKTKSGESIKITFGVRRSGKHAKASGPKARKVKKYRGQGR
jgi:hypothetical protein